jgi:innexin
MVVIPFTLIDLLAWFKRVFFFGTVYRYNFIKNRLLIYNKIKNVKEKLYVKLFTEYVIGADGVFMLRLIEHNSNAQVVTDLINQMWKKFKNEQK